MRIVIDDKIPYIREAMARITPDAVYLRGSDITSADLQDADALIVRTRTRCNEQLLAGSKVRFVATATIGIDHLDTAYLDRAGIRWVNCPGCNAGSVGQYIRSSLLRLSIDRPGVSLKDMTVGIVGCGHVGTKVRQVCEELGMRVLVNDPPKGCPDYVSIETIAGEADIISFHVPLIYNGEYPTFHLAGRRFFDSLAKRAYIINTSRGGVVDETVLLDAMHNGRVAGAMIDTWENEPHINHQLLDEAYIATPHIAGYSADGKVAADNMVIDSLCSFFDVENPGTIRPPSLPDGFVYTGNPLELYDPMEDTRKLRSNPELFEELRGNYPVRRETPK